MKRDIIAPTNPPNNEYNANLNSSIIILLTLNLFYGHGENRTPFLCSGGRYTTSVLRTLIITRNL